MEREADILANFVASYMTTLLNRCIIHPHYTSKKPRILIHVYFLSFGFYVCFFFSVFDYI